MRLQDKILDWMLWIVFFIGIIGLVYLVILVAQYLWATYYTAI